MKKNTPYSIDTGDVSISIGASSIAIGARKSPPYKYGEDKTLDEARTHIDATYGGHYVGEDNVQALDLIFATGHGESFCLGNALKYLARFGKKNGKNREDLLKAIHYAVLALHALDRGNK